MATAMTKTRCPTGVRRRPPPPCPPPARGKGLHPRPGGGVCIRRFRHRPNGNGAGRHRLNRPRPFSRIFAWRSLKRTARGKQVTFRRITSGRRSGTWDDDSRRSRANCGCPTAPRARVFGHFSNRQAPSGMCLGGRGSTANHPIAWACKNKEHQGRMGEDHEQATYLCGGGECRSCSSARRGGQMEVSTRNGPGMRLSRRSANDLGD